MQYLLYPLAIWAIAIAFTYLVTFLQLRKTRLQHETYELQKPGSTPTYLKRLFQIPIRELAELGFKPYGYLKTRPMLKLYPPINQEVLLYNKAHKTYAIVTINRPVEPANLFGVDFYTFFRDRELLITINGKAHGIIDRIDRAIVQDVYADCLSLQWQAHQDKLQSLDVEKTPCGIAPSVFVKELQANLKTYFDRLQAEKFVSPIQDTGLFRINFFPVLKLTRKLLKGNPKVAQMLKQRRQRAKADPSLKVEIPVELEVEGFQRMEQLQRGLVGRKFRMLVLLLSVGLFAASFTALFKSYHLAIFMGVLTLHEGGHLLAMKAFGYQDTSVFFVPFFGALATARQKEDATLSQKVVISLAGPLPGLILGIACAIASHNNTYPDWVREVSWMLISLNLFNLLPIYPLDGGKVADLLLFSKIPYLGVIFKGFGVAFLALLGLLQPILLLFALLIAWTIPNSFRSAQANASVQKKLQTASFENRETLLQAIFQHLKELGYGDLPFNTRFALAKDIMQRKQEFRSSLFARAMLVLLYAGSLLGGVAGTVTAIAPTWYRSIPVAFESPQKRRERFLQQTIDRATTTLNLNPKDIEAYQLRARAREGLDDEDGAIADYTQMLRLDPENAETYYSRARLRIARGDKEGAIADFNAIIQLNPKDPYVYVERGYMRQDEGNYQDAIADANIALKLNPQYPEAYELRGEARRNMGDETGAIADEQKAEQLYATLGEESY
ncbi:tetratricopeptide repeat protein [Lusitaniella coriacea LEGE 07157]|uniref:Tetratricopeptide repeat protein n=1 Tax=Lusitaniella coriacea LEGE 07157 TaxID=945747 RepID=A0A8J7B3X8_9CYAN|nr:site-2 protease family protein [Lusitaniella coriacea]MBE9115427.1 tetratricopeptide repeat protein [Lusitaniella coriacea LEGE 07157]